MSFEKDGQLCRFICDSCDETYEVQSHGFEDAWAEAKAEGWRCWPDEDTGDWMHKCPECRRG